VVYGGRGNFLEKFSYILTHCVPNQLFLVSKGAELTLNKKDLTGFENL
jgi:hypothetical protein